MPGRLHHSAMSREALNALPGWARDDLGAAAAQVADETCLFPDIYFDVHGGGHERATPYALQIDGIQFHYLPNTPIEGEYKYWQVDDRDGERRLRRVLIEPNENWRHADIGFRYYVGRCVDALREKRTRDAAGFLGTLFHVLQDAATFLHSLEGPDGTDLFVLNRLVEPPEGRLSLTPNVVLNGGETPFTIEGYRPALLGTSVAEAAFRLYSAYVDTVLRSRRKLLPLLTCIYSGDETGADELRREVLMNAARLSADTAHTILCVATGRFEPDQQRALDRVFVSDLKPVREPRGLSLPYRFFTMLRDAALDEDLSRRPLSLRLDGGKVTFEKGLGTGCHYDYRLTWEIPPAVYKAFSCAVGLHAELSRDGDFTAEVILDGRSAGRKRCTGDEPATRFECPAGSGGLLELCVTSDSGMGGGDRVNSIVWGDPVLSK